MLNLTYYQLYKINKQEAKMKLLECLENNSGNVSQTAQDLCCSRKTVIKWRDRPDLVELPRTPHHQPYKTEDWIEDLIVKERKKTNYGRLRMEDHLTDTFGLTVPTGTIRNIYKRKKLEKPKKMRGHFKGVDFYDWEKTYPLTQFQLDLKEILDQKPLSWQAYHWAIEHDLPLYQWTLIDVVTRIRFLAYSYEKTWANGLTFIRLVTTWLRSFGIQDVLTYQSDWGEEVGGKEISKLNRIQKEELDPLGVRLARIRKGKKEENGFVERSHKTDDTDFYTLHLGHIQNEQDFIKHTAHWQYYYNVRRRHYGKRMDGLTPLQKLKQSYPYFTEQFCIFPTVILDYLSADGLSKTRIPANLAIDYHVPDMYLPHFFKVRGRRRP